MFVFLYAAKCLEIIFKTAFNCEKCTLVIVLLIDKIWCLKEFNCYVGDQDQALHY